MKIRHYRRLWEFCRFLNMSLLVYLTYAISPFCWSVSDLTPVVLLVGIITWLGYQKNPYIVVEDYPKW